MSDKDSIGELYEAIEKARAYSVRLSPKQRRKAVYSRLADANTGRGYSRTRGGAGRSNRGPSKHLGARGPKDRTAAGRLNERSTSFRNAKRGWLDRESKAYVVQNAREGIAAMRRRQGAAAPYKRKLLGGGLKRVRKSGIDLSKAKPKTLYVYRPVENAEEILAWAKAQGFKSTLPAEKLHCTIIASATEINWATLFDDHYIEPAEERKSMCDCGPVYRWEDRAKTKTIEGGVREVKKLGDKGAVVLAFESLSLTRRWIDLRQAGAVSKFPSFVPHLTLTLSGDLPKDVQPYTGNIVLGEECWEEFKDGAYANVEEVVTKAALDDLSERLATLEKAQAKPEAA